MRLLTLSLALLLPIALLAQTPTSDNLHHRLSLYGGWTYSTVAVWATGPIPYIGIPDVEAHHYGHLGMGYDYLLTSTPEASHFYLSSGVAVTAVVAPVRAESDGVPYARTFVGVPLLLGREWRVGAAKAFALRTEAGVEPGWALDRTSSDWRSFDTPTPFHLNAVVGLSARWKRFTLGAHLRVGLTTYALWSALQHRYLGLATSVGYAFVQPGGAASLERF